MTQEELDAIEAREKAASPGPWWISTENKIIIPMGGANEKSSENAQFVFHARRDVPALLAEVKRLNAEKEHLTRECDAAVADLQEAATAISYQSICKLCSRSDCCVAYERGHRPLHCKGWQWRGVRE